MEEIIETELSADILCMCEQSKRLYFADLEAERVKEALYIELNKSVLLNASSKANALKNYFLKFLNAFFLYFTDIKVHKFI